jgi:cytochrome c peroxidase
MFKYAAKPLAAITSVLFVGALVGAGLTNNIPAKSSASPPPDPISGQDFPDESGTFSTVSITGKVDQSNPFFKSLGTNGRACVTCHQPKSGWSITPDSAQAVFDATNGLDPLFRTVDGSNSPDADVSTLDARRQAYSMLLTKGLIRVHLPIPANAEFTLTGTDDPYAHANAADLSLFRRPLPTTNLPFLNVVMWDGRETGADQSVSDDLMSQAEDAVEGHEQAMTGQTLPTKTLRYIVQLETSLFTSQTSDLIAGRLDTDGAGGGPVPLSHQQYYPGINDSLGFNPTGKAFDPHVFQLYSDWSVDPQPLHGPRVSTTTAAARVSIARGEALFNTKTFLIRNVPGLNDVLSRPVIRGTCSTCHDMPSVGSHSLPMMMNTGIADGSRRTPDMPLYTLLNTTTGETVQTTDPGYALVTGKWADIGKFKVPSLRGLETRSPYFHNGFTGDLNLAVDFYDTRFDIGFTTQEKADLVAFLPTL